MAVLGRITQQTDGLETLREIMELAKNPNAIIEAHETARKQSALTDEEVKKNDEARDFIKQYESLLSAMNERESALNTAKSQHLSNVADFNSFSSSEKIRLENIARDLDGKSQSQVLETARLISENSRLQTLEISLNKKSDEREKALDARESSIAQIEDTHASETARLKALSDKLKAKAISISEQVADIG